MTKFCLASDVHLDFGACFIENREGADCLILAGDIIEFDALTPNSELSYCYIDEFFSTVSDTFPQVIWVPGNHEYYQSNMQTSIARATNYLEAMHFGNVKILNNGTIDVGGTPVHGTTLWSRMNPLEAAYAESIMSDYRLISVRDNGIDRRLRATDVEREHRTAVEFLKGAVSDCKPCVVVTHHAPTYAILENAADSLSAAYATELSEFILDNPHIKTWCSGHTHHNADMMMGDTRLLVNCRGYAKYEPMAKKFKPLYFEV